nr:MAG TPA: structural protein [Caudoviricetes sp.]
MPNAMNVNTFIPKRVTRAIHTKNNGTTNWTTDQVQDFSIKVDGNEVTKQDANGNTIATVTKGKTCALSFATPLYDLNIVAAMNGTTKKVASDSSKIDAISFQEFIIGVEQTTIVLTNKAIDGSISVMTLDSNNCADKVFKVGGATSADTVTYTDDTKTITFASGAVSAGDKVLVKYDYETDSGVGFTASANDQAETGKLYVEVEGFSICDQDTKIFAYYYFPAAKMQSSYETKIDLESTITINMDCAVEYCDSEKAFYSVVIPTAKTEE